MQACENIIVMAGLPWFMTVGNPNRTPGCRPSLPQEFAQEEFNGRSPRSGARLGRSAHRPKTSCEGYPVPGLRGRGWEAMSRHPGPNRESPWPRHSLFTDCDVVSWARLDDSCYDHPKIESVSDRAFGRWVKLILYCSRHLTDGAVPIVVANRIASDDLQPLIDAGLVDSFPGKVTVHDYLHWQQSRAQVEAIRRERAAAGRIGGLSKRSSNCLAKAQAKPLALAKHYPLLSDSSPNPIRNKGGRRGAKRPDTPS